MLSTFYIKINVLFKKQIWKMLLYAARMQRSTLNATMTRFSPDSAADIWWSYQSPSFIVPSILVMFLGRATQAKIRFLVFVVSSDGLCRKTLSDRRLQVHPRAHVVVTEEAWVGWQSVVGKYGIVIWGARAGGVFTRRWILFERSG